MRLYINTQKINVIICLFATIYSSSVVYAQNVIFEPDGLISLSSSSTYVLGNGASLVNNSNNSKLDGTFVFEGPYSFNISGDSSTEFNHLVINNDALVNLLSDVNFAS